MQVERITVTYSAKVDLGAISWREYIATNPKFTVQQNRYYDNCEAGLSMTILLGEKDDPTQAVEDALGLLRGKVEALIAAGSIAEVTTTVSGAQTYETKTVIGREEEFS